jgi:hypothetical protein
MNFWAVKKSTLRREPLFIVAFESKERCYSSPSAKINQADQNKCTSCRGEPIRGFQGRGRISQRAVAYRGQPAVRRLLPLSLTFDHRIVTGGEGARFLVALTSDLELMS